MQAIIIVIDLVVLRYELEGLMSIVSGVHLYLLAICAKGTDEYRQWRTFILTPDMC